MLFELCVFCVFRLCTRARCLLLTEVTHQSNHWNHYFVCSKACCPQPALNCLIMAILAISLPQYRNDTMYFINNA